MNSTPFTILIDGQCALCRREAAFMQRLDRGRGLLRIVDIAAPDFEAGAFGVTIDALMGQIHGVAPDGTMLRGMEVFRRAWRAVGYGWVLAPTAWPLVRPIADAAYRWFARHRLRLTGRCTPESCATAVR